MRATAKKVLFTLAALGAALTFGIGGRTSSAHATAVVVPPIYSPCMLPGSESISIGGFSVVPGSYSTYGVAINGTCFSGTDAYVYIYDATRQSGITNGWAEVPVSNGGFSYYGPGMEGPDTSPFPYCGDTLNVWAYDPVTTAYRFATQHIVCGLY